MNSRVQHESGERHCSPVRSPYKNQPATRVFQWTVEDYKKIRDVWNLSQGTQRSRQASVFY
ncbi:hypothetical protein AMELA_G00251010 [Ameiurus melas]|uniref:Uncharacterized protein n=1 Tax=Ameiurus melas TaxID=219545 RepID=A0A7J5ZWS9_AMEME|nr:hypothetical protein AMELA_G00251010 [Ameiurus melas]